MTTIETIRAALEQAGEYIRGDLASERGAFEGHEGVSRIAEIKIDLANNSAALSALAELERAAAEPVAEIVCTESPGGISWDIKNPDGSAFRKMDHVGKLYTTPPPAPVAEMREPVEVTPEMSSRVANSYFGIDTPANMSDMLEVLRYWQRELGPTIGLMAWREPTPAECERIARHVRGWPMATESAIGLAMFDAVRAVMWPKRDTEIARLETDLELVQMDAARYCYLAKLMCGEPVRVSGDGELWIRWILPSGILSERTTLAAAIDEARAGGRGSGA